MSEIDFEGEMMDTLWQATEGQTKVDGTLIRRLAKAALPVQERADEAQMDAFAKVVSSEIDEERDKLIALFQVLGAPAAWIQLAVKNTHRMRSTEAMRAVKVA
jgi:hypothetical protein